MERDVNVVNMLNNRQHFNSHAHVERDKHCEKGHIHPEDFNSHAHVERDDKLSQLFYCHVYFNSHAHVERDFTHEEIYIRVRISTHTLTWSVT